MGIKALAVSVVRRCLVEHSGEVCLEEEVERLRRSGMSAPEIACEMGVDVIWVEELVSAGEDPAERSGEA